ncbi:Bug family tripartite tricarboxylate transporter substrate binding protein [Pseudorhodobacter sp. W20_MBD10_FR17]|uniref:Bug family tripartite tricarboxylate transporter substrate binding protein n=1 Tax=Pseudorhodobacter sp. W20_MBD10_FR17 TaxID=3240266 RepID=UPI003F95CCA7
MNITRRAALMGAVALTLATPVLAQTAAWPTKPLHAFVGFPAGSSPDLLARIVTEPLAAKLGQPIVIENKPGAGGVIGIQQMLNAKDQNYAFGTTINGPMTTAPRLVPDLGYDVAADITPVVLIATSPLVLVVAADFAGTDLAAFIAAAGAEPEALSYGSVGKGSGAHLTAELFSDRAGIEMLHVPYTSYAEVTTAIIGHEIDAGFMAPSAAMQYVQAGTLKILGITSLKPFDQAPGVPVMAGQGGLPADFRAELWNAFIAPAGTDAAVVATLNTDLNAILADADVQKRLADMGWQVAGGTAEELQQRITDDTKIWGAVLDRIDAKK